MEEVVTELCTYGFHTALHDLSEKLPDELQVEHLVQVSYDRLVKPKPVTTDVDILQKFTKSVCHSQDSSFDVLTRHLFTTIRTEPPASTENIPNLHHRSGIVNDKNQVRKHMDKHNIKKEKRKGSGSTSAILTDVDGFRDVLEKALCFRAFVHSFDSLSPQQRCDFPAMKESVHQMIRLVRECIYRGDNSVDTETCKIHSHLHLVDDISEFGNPMNWEAGKGERGLKLWAKLVSKTAQRHGEGMFLEQTAQRVADSLLLAKSSFMIQQQQPIPEQKNREEAVARMGRRVSHIVYNLSSQKGFYQNGKGKPDNKADDNEIKDLVTPHVLKALLYYHPLERNELENEIRIFKEAVLRDNSRVRAYHKFDRYGPYFDWVNVLVEEDDGRQHYIPAKVLLLYQDSSNTNFALVWMAEKVVKEKHVTRRWSMSWIGTHPQISRIEIDEIEKACFAIEQRRSQTAKPQVLPLNQKLVNRKKFLVDVSNEQLEWAKRFVSREAVT
jgi:hypothetical protein